MVVLTFLSCAVCVADIVMNLGNNAAGTALVAHVAVEAAGGSVALRVALVVVRFAYCAAGCALQGLEVPRWVTDVVCLDVGVFLEGECKLNIRAGGFGTLGGRDMCDVHCVVDVHPMVFKIFIARYLYFANIGNNARIFIGHLASSICAAFYFLAQVVYRLNALSKCLISAMSQTVLFYKRYLAIAAKCLILYIKHCNKL